MMNHDDLRKYLDYDGCLVKHHIENTDVFQNSAVLISNIPTRIGRETFLNQKVNTLVDGLSERHRAPAS